MEGENKKICKELEEMKEIAKVNKEKWERLQQVLGVDIPNASKGETGEKLEVAKQGVKDKEKEKVKDNLTITISDSDKNNNNTRRQVVRKGQKETCPGMKGIMIMPGKRIREIKKDGRSLETVSSGQCVTIMVSM